MTPDGIRKFLGKDWTETEALIRSSLGSDIDLLNTTNEALLSNSGKQLRPLMSLLVARACSGGSTTEDSIRFAAASEMLHNATLLHDDVVDGSTERRGVPTVMSVLGGPAAVLIGDYWLVKSMENILASPTHSEEVTRIFSKTLSDLAEGEMLQLQKAACCDTDEEDYYRIIYSKTASLFEATGLSAAISVDAPSALVEAIRAYSVSLGTAFQIKDDILDYSGEPKIGKPTGVDLGEQKITLPLLGALRSVDGEEDAAIRRKVMQIHDHPQFKDEIRSFVFSHSGNEYASMRLDEYVEKAVDALKVLPDSKEKNYLVAIAEFTASRDR
ncbi:MAG: polyprenyl synthetase family protein [Bacteroidales bacterium]|nr:polyprenyl synthetase family protein [Bacteroidales bacterium]